MALIEIDDVPSERNLHLFWGFSMAMLNNQMVNRIPSGKYTRNYGKSPYFTR